MKSIVADSGEWVDGKQWLSSPSVPWCKLCFLPLPCAFRRGFQLHGQPRFGMLTAPPGDTSHLPYTEHVRRLALSLTCVFLLFHQNPLMFLNWNYTSVCHSLQPNNTNSVCKQGHHPSVVLHNQNAGVVSVCIMFNYLVRT